jgi:diguanylate cyclase (GGDEF)-like protein
VLTDHEGRLWVGTFGRGIQVERRHDPQGARRFQRLSTRNGLPHNGVDRLLIDPQGTVWASTDGGIARIDPSDLTIRALRQAQGVGIATYWTGAGTVSVAGEPMFGGIGGLTVIHPDRLGKEEAAAPLTITEAHVGNQPVPPARLLEAPLQVNAENRNLMVEFAALDFAAPEFRRYSYRLLGFDSDWTVTPASRRLASYTNLPPGSYTLQLRSAPVDKPWGEPLEIPVQVQAAWFQRDSVRVGAGILFLLAVGALVHLRTVYLRRRQGELQRLVAERTAELEQRGRELQQSHEELRRSQEQLEKMAYFDPLTGLPNRRMFNDDLRQLIARSMRGQGDFALVLVDLDGFKQINDHSGHHAGDSLLVVVADRLRSLVRDSDCIARLGGDEFAVLLANNAVFDPERVEAMCARMLASLREPMLVAGQTMQITASLGIAPCPRDGASPDELYKAADTALYEAKRSGRNTWRWSMPKMFTYTV